MASIYVFGSSIHGVHSKHDSLKALQKYGAIYGQGEGIQGNSYAIPVKSRYMRGLPITTIKSKVETFIAYVDEHPEKMFFISRIGCEPSAYTDEEMLPLFTNLPPNCVLNKTWEGILSTVTE